MSNHSTQHREPDDTEGPPVRNTAHHVQRNDPISDGKANRPTHSRLLTSRPTFICIGSADRAGIATDADDEGPVTPPPAAGKRRAMSNSPEQGTIHGPSVQKPAAKRHQHDQGPPPDLPPALAGSGHDVGPHDTCPTAPGTQEGYERVPEGAIQATRRRDEEVEEELKADARKRELGLQRFDEVVKKLFNISPDTVYYATSLSNVTSSDILRMGVKTEVLTFDSAADLMSRVKKSLDIVAAEIMIVPSKSRHEAQTGPQKLSQELASFWDELAEEKRGVLADLHSSFKNVSPETEARAKFIVTLLLVKLTIFCDEQGIASLYAFPELALSSAPQDCTTPGMAKTYPENMVVIQHGQNATMVSGNTDLATAFMSNNASDAHNGSEGILATGHFKGLNSFSPARRSIWEMKKPRGVSIQSMVYQAIAEALACLRQQSTDVVNSTDSDESVQLFVATTGIVWVFGWVEGGVRGKENREAYIIPLRLTHHLCPASERSQLGKELKSVFLFLACWTFVAPTTIANALKGSAIKTPMPKGKVVGTMSF